MSEPIFIVAAVAVATTITVFLRALPFGLRAAVQESELLDDVGRWMPLGAVTVLSVYLLAKIDVTTADYGLPQIVGILVTVAVHAWRRNAVLSILAGTTACLVLANGAFI